MEDDTSENNSENNSGNTTTWVILLLKIILAIVILVGLWMVAKWLDESDIGKGIGEATNDFVHFLDGQLQACSKQATCKNFDSSSDKCNEEATCVYLEKPSKSNPDEESDRCVKKNAKRTTGSGGLISLNCYFGLAYIIVPFGMFIGAPICKALFTAAEGETSYFVRGATWVGETVSTYSTKLINIARGIGGVSVDTMDAAGATTSDIAKAAGNLAMRQVGTSQFNQMAASGEEGVEALAKTAAQAEEESGMELVNMATLVSENVGEAAAAAEAGGKSAADEFGEVMAKIAEGELFEYEYKYRESFKPFFKGKDAVKRGIYIGINEKHKYNIKLTSSRARLHLNMAKKHGVKLDNKHINYLEKHL